MFYLLYISSKFNVHVFLPFPLVSIQLSFQTVVACGGDLIGLSHYYLSYIIVIIIVVVVIVIVIVIVDSWSHGVIMS